MDMGSSEGSRGKSEKRASDSFDVTYDWLHAHATASHGWTRAQLAVFGITWPPKRGWLSTLVGRVVTHEDRVAFERAREVRVGRR